MIHPGFFFYLLWFCPGMQAYQEQKNFLHDDMSSLVQQDPWLCLLDLPDFF